jgi:hypothetical protein
LANGEPKDTAAAMEREPSRRSFIAAIGAAAAATALAPAKASAAPDQVGPAYRTAGELVPALAGGQVSSRELVDSAIAGIEALDPKINAVGEARVHCLPHELENARPGTHDT